MADTCEATPLCGKTCVYSTNDFTPLYTRMYTPSLRWMYKFHNSCLGPGATIYVHRCTPAQRRLAPVTPYPTAHVRLFFFYSTAENMSKLSERAAAGM